MGAQDYDNRLNWITVSVLGLFVTFIIQICTAMPQIAGKIEFPSDCTDGDGVVRSHLEEWTSSTGSCDRRLCYTGLLETTKWLITYDCPDSADIFDPDNCEYVSNSGLAFPDCCPTLQCSTGVLNTVTQAACYDQSPADSCEFWRNQTNCVDSPTDVFKQLMYNWTTEYCRYTCGFC